MDIIEVFAHAVSNLSRTLEDFEGKDLGPDEIVFTTVHIESDIGIGILATTICRRVDLDAEATFALTKRIAPQLVAPGGPPVVPVAVPVPLFVDVLISLSKTSDVGGAQAWLAVPTPKGHLRVAVFAFGRMRAGFIPDPRLARGAGTIQ